MPEFDIDAALGSGSPIQIHGHETWWHQRDDPWGLCQFFMGAGFQYAAISRWPADDGRGQRVEDKDTFLLELGVPESVPWFHDTPAEQIDEYADWVEGEAKRLVGGTEVERLSLYVGTTDADIAIYFDMKITPDHA